MSASAFCVGKTGALTTAAAVDSGGVVEESVFTCAFAKLENINSTHTTNRFNILAPRRKYL